MISDGSRHARPAAEPGLRTVVVRLPAEIDGCNDGRVHDALARALDSGAVLLIADTTRTTFCDCAGLGALSRVHRQAAAAGGQLRIAASPAVRRILRLTRTDHLDTYPSVAAALACPAPHCSISETPTSDAPVQRDGLVSP